MWLILKYARRNFLKGWEGGRKNFLKNLNDYITSIYWSIIYVSLSFILSFTLMFRCYTFNGQIKNETKSELSSSPCSTSVCVCIWLTGFAPTWQQPPLVVCPKLYRHVLQSAYRNCNISMARTAMRRVLLYRRSIKSACVCSLNWRPLPPWVAYTQQLLQTFAARGPPSISRLSTAI